MKKNFYLPILLFCSVLSSCSISIVKRRYNPGYHVDVTHTNKNYRINRSSQTVIEPNQSNLLKLTPTNINPTISVTNPIVIVAKNNSQAKITKDQQKKLPNTGQGKTKKIIHRNQYSINELLGVKDISSTRLRKKLMWTFGGLSITFGTLFITTLIISFTIILFDPLILRAIVFGIWLACLILAIILGCLSIHFAARKRMDDNYIKPVKIIKEGRIRPTTFIVGWVLGGLAMLLAFISIFMFIKGSISSVMIGLLFIGLAFLFAIAAFVVGFWKKKKKVE